MRGFIVPAICALIFAGCASTSGTQTPRRSANVITAEEIAASTAKDAAEAINLLRPQWLTTRGVSLALYLNNSRVMDPAIVQTIPATSIAEIRYLSSSEATTFFGTGNMGGAIVVKTK